MVPAIMSFQVDVAPAFAGHFNAWYDGEHLPERVGLPGFLSGTRYCAVRDPLRYLTVYRVRRLADLKSAAYLGRLNNPTPWTRKVMQTIAGGRRLVYAVDAGAGDTLGGFAAVYRFATSGDGATDDIAGWLAELQAGQGITRAQYWSCDTGLSDVATEERRLRGDAETPPSACMFIEATSAGDLAAAADGVEFRRRLRALGARGRISGGRFRVMSHLASSR